MQIKFGQSFPAQLNVNPHSGRVGSTFYINGSKFDPNSELELEIIDPGGHTVYSHKIRTDQNGNAGYANLMWTPGKNMIEGRYVLKGHGKYDSKSVNPSTTFSVTSN